MFASFALTRVVAIYLFLFVYNSLAQPSPTPNCYVCPDNDKALFALTEANYGSTDVMVCFYTEPWYCSYDLVSVL